jgi:peptidoglycan/LPS O-acetylase OafA/YrhL
MRNIRNREAVFPTTFTFEINCAHYFHTIAGEKMLSDYDGKRENNFTLLRLIFAWLVLYGHSFPITDPRTLDPISRLMVPYAWLGSIAVSGFFVVSGFLVTASFTQRGPVNFIASRALRLYPAAIVYSLVMIFVLGPIAKTVDFSTYWQAQPWLNAWNSLLWKWEYNLPYVFPSHPIPSATNGSTWTLPVELRCYIAVLFLGLSGAFTTKRTANFALFLLLFTVVWNYANLPFFNNETPRVADPLLFFIAGSLAWVNRDMIQLRWPIALVAAAAPFLLAKTGFREAVYVVGFSYVILFAAYRLPHVNLDKIGDISYGVYIYAWPIQQLVWYPGQGGLRNAVYSSAIVIPLAYLSWKLIEKPALNARRFLPSKHSVKSAIGLRKQFCFPIAASAAPEVIRNDSSPSGAERSKH